VFLQASSTIDKVIFFRNQQQVELSLQAFFKSVTTFNDFIPSVKGTTILKLVVLVFVNAFIIGNASLALRFLGVIF
jgi:hypothetical protein